MLESHATDRANHESATGIILTCDAMSGDRSPIVADAQAIAPWARESIEMKRKSQIDLEKRIMRHAMKC